MYFIYDGATWKPHLGYSRKVLHGAERYDLSLGDMKG
jgi:hypothetical protein